MATLLSVNNYYYRRDGSEVVYFEHNQLMKKAGWNTIPFAMKHPKNVSSQWDSFFIDEIEFGHQYSLIEKLKRLPKIIYSVEAQKKITALIEQVSLDICHCHTIYHHISPSILSTLKKHNIPVVMTLHDLKISCPAYHMYNHDKVCEDCKEGGLHKVISNRCVKGSVALSTIVYAEAVLHHFLGSYADNVDKFISPCKFYIEKLVEFGWDRSKFIYIPNPIDLKDYQPAFGAGDNYILYFGRLSPEKGLLTLLKAAAQQDVQIVFAGDGPQRQALEKLAADLKVNAIFHGHVSGDKLHQLIKNAKATVLPAQWYENAPMSVLESYALGKPVIGANIGGIPELVIDGTTGKLFESGSVSELANLLAYFTQLSDAEITRYGHAAREHVENNFSSELYLERIESLYNTLLPKSS